MLWHAGRTVGPKYRAAAIRRTKMFFEDREGFLALMVADMQRLEREANDLEGRLAVRLNNASDISWESVAPWLFSQFPNCCFYDYTKSVKRALASAHRGANWPSNYWLTYSVSDAAGSDGNAESVLLAGGNVAVVVRPDFEAKRFRYSPLRGWNDALPKTLWYQGIGYDAVDGDQHDLRLPRFDGQSSVVLLRFKSSGCSQERKSIEADRFLRTITPLSVLVPNTDNPPIALTLSGRELRAAA